MLTNMALLTFKNILVIIIFSILISTCGNQQFDHMACLPNLSQVFIIYFLLPHHCDFF